jgi:type VI secretion system secreted protein VgrG
MDYFSDAGVGKQLFSFISRAGGLEESSFAVVNFKGYESLSKPYEFEILLVSGEPELDLEAVINASARFTIHRAQGDDVHFNGILEDFEQLHEFNRTSPNIIRYSSITPYRNC